MMFPLQYKGFPGGSDSKKSICNAGNSCLIPELDRSPGEGNGSPLQYSCLEDSMDGTPNELEYKGGNQHMTMPFSVFSASESLSVTSNSL